MDNILGSMSPSSIRVAGFISQKVLRGLSAYQVAVANGFVGTQTEWLQSLRGESIQFRSDGLDIYYKYESDPGWTLLISIDKLLADYSVLDNKPSINDVELNGNKTLDDLGIQAKGDYVQSQAGYGLISDTEKERLSHVDNYDDSEIRQAIEAIILAAVTGVKGSAESVYRKGNVNITPENLGLGNVDNTHDINKNVHSAVQDSVGNKIDETYFSGINKTGGEVFLTRPDGSNQKLMNSEHVHDASEITTGTIDIARLPAGALERMIDVANRQARYALTTAQVQNGDTVRQLDTGVMYRVVDDTKLNRSDGYKEYTAGRASAVPWSGVEDKPSTFTPSAHTHEISQITDIANASVAEAAKLKTPRTIAISGGVTASGVQFDGSGNITLQVSDVDSSYLSGTADINITGNAATATQFARERTIEVTGKATAAPKVYDGRQNIALEITDLDAAEKNHTHTVADITDLGTLNTDEISNFETSNTDNYSDVWFSDPLKVNKPVHNSGIQYNPYRDILKAGIFQGALRGNADTATALASDAGSATQPVYIANGVPVATTYQLNKTVPADAVFTDTDTHYTSDIVFAGNFSGKVNSPVALTNGNVYLNHVENNQVTSSHRITGVGTTTVTTDEYGNLIINATGQSYTEGYGISISNYVITNTGVRSISQSTERGNITVNTNGIAANVPVYGLGTAAYTDSTDYATSTHKHNFSDIQNKPSTLSGYGITDAAASSHEHDASEITSGTIDIARLPAGALERLVVVANETARYALTKERVQTGDTVQQEDTGVMYRVVDDNYLDRASGYKEYTAGAASSVPWAGITGKPESFAPSAHTHTASEISDLSGATVAKANTLSTARTIALSGAVTGSGSFDGSENLTITTEVNHTHPYAGAQTAGGSANSALRLDTSSAGSSVIPVYFYDGVPVAMDYQLNKTVPADAVFTDTHYASTTIINSAEDSTSNSTRAITNGNVFINHVENGVVKASHRILGSGTVTVTYNAEGDLVIDGVGGGIDGPVPNPYALSINGVTYDGSVAVDVGVIDVAHGGTGSSSVDTSPTQNSTRMVTSGGLYDAFLGKADSVHTHQYAGSSTVGGSATMAEKLNSSVDAGSLTQPVYFSGGVPVATTYSLNATVPADAVFTDTHHQSKMVVSSESTGRTDTDVALTNGYVFMNHVENNEVRSSHKISGTGSVTVRTDSSGNIVINAEDTKYTSLPNPYALSINGTTYDGSSAVDVGTIDVAHGGTGNTSADTEPVENSTKFLPSGAVYTALQGKADASHTHNYAGSNSAGGSANSAVKLDSNAGSATQPIFFSGGKPTATTYALNATVPADAVFTDTHYTSKNVVASTNSGTSDTDSSLTNTHVFLNHIENGVVTSSHRISGSGSAAVTTDSSGNIIITAEDTKYTALPNPYSLSINGTTYDGSEQVSVGVIGVAYGGTGNSSADTEPVEDSTKFLPSGAIYTALQGKADTNHSHLYAGSSTAGGSATSALKLDSNAGSGTQPVYFTGGKPTPTTYELNATVPADAVFTDTHYASKTVVAGNNSATSDTSSSLSNTYVFLNHVENGVVVSAHRISGTGAATVTTDASGNIIINAEDTKYSTLPNPYALTIQANGTSLGTYDGSSAESFNITYSNVGAAAASHGHAWSDLTSHPTTISGYGITDQLAPKTHVHDASEIQSGVFDIARIPVAALERLVVVDDLTEMYTLTVNDIQLGDTVQCEDTGIMYRVVDVSNLDNANGYKEYTAGAAASVPWTGITGKPSTFTPSSHTHQYAGSSSVGGSANSAEKLNPLTDAGSGNQPVYFSGGKPTACTYELNKTVPANAEFTDTHHQAKNVVAGTSSAVANTSSALANTYVFLNLVENGAVRSSHRISGGGDATVTTDASGNIIITATDTKYTHPTHTSKTSGMYKITVDELGHVSGATAIVKADITGLGISASDHTHTLTLATDSGTNQVTLAAQTKYKLTAGGKSIIFTTAPDTKYTHPTHTAYSSGLYKVTVDALGHVTGATAVAKADITGLGISGSDHTHTLSIASSSGTSQIALSPSTKYQITAGGNTYIFTTPADSKYTGSNGITLDGSNFVNSGVRSVSSGSTNGTISVNTGGTSAEVAVKGLKSAAYTESSAYATSGHEHTLTLVKDTSATSTVTLEASQIYKLTAGGKTIVFTTTPDTKYSQGTGITISGTTISNSGVRSVSQGSTNGTISVNTNGTSAEVAVKGLGSAAYTNSTAYSAAGHTHNYAGSDSAGGVANSAAKLSGSVSLVVGLSNVSSSTNVTSFDGSKNLDGSSVNNPTIPITGTLSVGHGGTGATTFTANGILYGNGTNAVSSTNYGSAGFLLKANGSSSAPSWVDPSTISVNKASTLTTSRHLLVKLGTSASTGAEFDGSANADIPVNGQLGVANGGTGLSTVTANGILYGNGTNAMQVLAPGGSAGMVLTTNGANTAPSWTAQSSLNVGSAGKLTNERTITLAVASGANGGVTGSVTTSFNGNVTLNTTLSAHTHATSDITSGVLEVARGGTGYNSIDATPTAGSDHVVKSSGVHKRIAYRKITLSRSGWGSAYKDTMFGNATTYRQAITVGNDVTADTEIVSVKLDGSQANHNTTYNYSQEFTGNGSTKTFTLSRTPTTITSVTRGGVSVAASGYSFSGTSFTITEAPNTGTKLIVNYAVIYSNESEFCKIKQVETGASLIEVRAISALPVDLTLVVGYVSETLETSSTQATLPSNSRFTT